MPLSEANKTGKPIGFRDPLSPNAKRFRSIATKIKVKLDVQEKERIRSNALKVDVEEA